MSLSNNLFIPTPTKYEYWNSSGLWYWHYKAANGKIVAAGEGYNNKADCLSAIGLLKSSANADVKEKNSTLLGGLGGHGTS